MAADQATSAWKQIRDHYFLQGNVDQMLFLRHRLYEEILAAKAVRRRQPAGFLNESDMLRACAIAASLFILMLEKKKAAEMLHPYVDSKKYPEADFVNHAAIARLESQVRKGVLDTVAVCSILTQVTNLCYRSFLRDYETGLNLTKKAEALFVATEKHHDYKASPEMHLPFLLTRHENLLHLSLFQWRVGKEQMSEARRCLEDSMRELTIAYERLLALPQHAPLAGSVEVLLTQTLGSLAERLWIEEPGTGWSRARIYRSLQTHPRPKEADEQIPGRSIDSCRRGYAFILASRIEADDTTTAYRLSIALAKDAERCFDDLAETLREEPHAWKIRARTQKLRCYIQAEKMQLAKMLYEELVGEVENIKNKDPEEYDFAKGSLALSHTWMLEREAEEAPFEQREELWRQCLAQAREIIQSDRIPGRLKRDGLLHQGRAWLNLAICLRRKGGRAENPRSYENRGCELIQEAIAQARDRHHPKIEAAAHLYLAEGLRESDPSAAATSLGAAAQLLAQSKSTYFQRQLDKLYSETPIVEDGFVTLSLNLSYPGVLEDALEAAYFDYHYDKAGKKRSVFLKNTGWDEKRFQRTKKKINERRGIFTDSRSSNTEEPKGTPYNHEGQEQSNQEYA